MAPDRAIGIRYATAPEREYSALLANMRAAWTADVGGQTRRAQSQRR